MLNVKRILNKKKPTGEDVGRVFLYNTVTIYKQTLETRDYSILPKGVVTQEEINKMLSLLTSEDMKKCNAYVDITNYITKEQGFANAYYTLAKLGYCELINQIHALTDVENKLTDIARQPLVLTQKQYSDYVREITQEQRNIYFTYTMFIYNIFEFYYEKYKKSPKAKNPLSKAIKTYTRKDILNPRINANGERVLNNLQGYYSNIFEQYDVKYKTFSKELEEFKNDFAELWETLTKTATSLLPAAESYKINSRNFKKPFVTLGELADKKILNFHKDVSTANSLQVANYIRQQDLSCKAIFNGICILNTDDENERNTDEQGYYKNNYDVEDIAAKGISNFEDYAENIETARENELICGLTETYAYNTMLDIVTDITGIDVSVFSLRPLVSNFEQKITNLNELIDDFCKIVKTNNQLLSEQEGEKRMTYAVQAFPKIDVNKLKPTTAAIRKTKQYVADLKAFKINTPLIIQMLKGGENNE